MPQYFENKTKIRETLETNAELSEDYTIIWQASALQDKNEPVISSKRKRQNFLSVFLLFQPNILGLFLD